MSTFTGELPLYCRRKTHYAAFASRTGLKYLRITRSLRQRLSPVETAAGSIASTSGLFGVGRRSSFADHECPYVV